MYNFSPATPDEEMVFGACRPAHPRYAPSDHSVDDWLDYMDQQDVERVCCLLDDAELAAYDGLLDAYTDHFGPERVCHAPIEDFESVDETLFHETIRPFLEAAVERSERVVVHCSAGQGRTGHVLVLWLVHERGYDLDAAIEAVAAMGRSPLEAVDRSGLESLVRT